MITPDHLIAAYYKAKNQKWCMMRWEASAELKRHLNDISDNLHCFMINGEICSLMNLSIEFIHPSEWRYDFPLILVLTRGKIAVDSDGEIYELEF